MYNLLRQVSSSVSRLISQPLALRADQERVCPLGIAQPSLFPMTINLNGQRYEVVFDGVSAYDGTRYCSVVER